MTTDEQKRPETTSSSPQTLADSQEPWVDVGKIVKTVGVRGWVRVTLLSDNPSRFKKGARLYVKRRSREVNEEVVVNAVKEHFSGEMLNLLFEGIKDCDQAAGLVNSYLVIPQNLRQKLRDKNSFYPDELVDMQVLSPEGDLVGRVVRLESEAPSPFLVTQIDDLGEILIPFRKVFVSEIDRKARTLRLAKPASVHALSG